MEAVVHELIRRDIAPDIAALLSLGHEVSDHATELLIRQRDLPASMHECRQFGVVVPTGLMGDESIGLEHCFESLSGVAGLVSDFGEIVEVGCDLTFMPGVKDRLDAWEVFVHAG